MAKLYMKSKKKKNTRQGRVAEISKLDFHDFSGRLIDRTRAKVTERDKGVLMIQNIKDRFNLSDIDIQEFRRVMHQRELEDFEDMKIQAEIIKRKNLISQPIKWTRDEKGNVISPFDLKARKDREKIKEPKGFK